jgi:UDP-glucose 4-epimerase
MRGTVDVRLGDVRDAEFVRDISQGIDVVMHLAALIAIPYSYIAPRSFVDTNVNGTLNVLEAARTHDCRVVAASTSEVYGTPKYVPITEAHPLQGQSPYSASKIAADMLCHSYAMSFEMPVTILRPFNTYGPRQSARAVIPTILGQLLAGITELRLGSVTPRRDFTFVSDTVNGFVRAGESHLTPGSLVHLGTGSTISIAELVSLCSEITGVEARIVTEELRVRPQGSEVEVLLSDPSLAREVLDWESTVGLREGLQRTVEWLAPRVDIGRARTYQR